VSLHAHVGRWLTAAWAQPGPQRLSTDPAAGAVGDCGVRNRTAARRVVWSSSKCPAGIVDQRHHPAPAARNHVPCRGHDPGGRVSSTAHSGCSLAVDTSTGGNPAAGLDHHR
jgi:hypothetical protein